jgi:23S rRNA (uracil1939-C5)-methyltransferase
LPLPVEKNQRLTLTIDSYNAEGAGVGRYQGAAVFVPGTVAGESVDVLVIKVAAQYAVAKALRIISPSKNRIAAPCPVYDKCGGCSLMHMDADEQQKLKRQRIYDCFLRIAHIELPDLPVVHSMDDATRYRNKAAFPVGLSAGMGDGPENTGKSEPLIGLYAQRSHRIVGVDNCLLQHHDHAAVIRAVRAWMADNRVEPYDEITHRGLVRHIVSRRSTSGDWLVCLVSTGALPHAEKLVQRLRADVPSVSGIVESINRRFDNVIMGDKERVLFGNPRLDETLMGLEFSVSIQSFMQVNPVQTEVLYRLALDFAGLSGNEHVVDAYCGIGTMTLLFARHARFVDGIECVPAAIEDALINAELNGITNTAFHCGLAEQVLPRLLRESKADVLLLDPPRKGCDSAVLSATIKAGIPKIVYVSCDPATLARDTAELCRNGYKLDRVEGVDMFGQTSHVETVALLTKE